MNDINPPLHSNRPLTAARNFARLALAAAFLSAVADRLGMWGLPETAGVSWGSIEDYEAYVAKLNPFLPTAVIPTVGWVVTVLEVVLAIGLILGRQLRWFALASGILLTIFAVAMAAAIGPKPPLDYSVLSAAGAAFLLAATSQHPNPSREITRRSNMKVVVIGGTGLIGKKVVALLEDRGHEVVAASPSRGVNTLTGDGLQNALAGAEVVVDASNAPSFAPDAVMSFFETSTRNLIAAGKQAGVAHLVVLSVVNADRLKDSGYMRAKVVQEKQIMEGGIPYTIVRATQFFEFLDAIAEGSTVDGAIRLPAAPMQPLAADDVARELASCAKAKPVNGIVDLAGPERSTLAGCIERMLQKRGDPRKVTASSDATYFGALLDDWGLAPGGDTRIGSTTFDEWASSAAADLRAPSKP